MIVELIVQVKVKMNLEAEDEVELKIANLFRNKN